MKNICQRQRSFDLRPFPELSYFTFYLALVTPPQYFGQSDVFGSKYIVPEDQKPSFVLIPNHVQMLSFGIQLIKITMKSNKQLKIKEFNQNDIPGYRPLVLLGQGSYGSVFLCQDTKEKKTWAVKVLPISDTEDSILRKVKKHKNILRPQHSYIPIGSDRYFLCYQPMISDLHRYYQNTIFTPVERRQLIFQMLQALQHLHGLLICHGDIKSDNILIGECRPATFYLSDFSLARFYTNMTQLEGEKDFARDILQLAAMVWSLSFRASWNYRIHYMNVQDWANDKELQATFSQTTCEATNAFFKATLGAPTTSQVKKPHQLLKLFPNNTEKELDDQKFVHPVKIRSLRSQRLEFRPIPEVSVEQSQSKQVVVQPPIIVQPKGESSDGIDRETYGDIVLKKIQRIQLKDPEMGEEIKRKYLKRLERLKIMKKARNSRRLSLKLPKKTIKCTNCFKMVGNSNYARHKKSCVARLNRKRRQEREKEVQKFMKKCMK